MSYLATGINESPTIVAAAASDITDVRGRAVKFSSGKLALAGAGEAAIGVAILTNDDTIKSGQDVTVQITACGLWEAGGEITAGDMLASDANGKAVTATDGDFVVGFAMEAASAAGRLIQVQITKSGYSGSGGGGTVSMADLTDVDLTDKANGKVLKYNGTTSKWECEDDAVTG